MSGSRDSLLSSFTGVMRPRPRPIDHLLRPIRSFAHHKLAGAGLLMLATIAAIVWANSPAEHSYHELLHTHLTMSFGDFRLDKTLHHWVNDGLMAVFFFLVGLEIKRELIVGELSSVRKATLPAVAAVGGMVVPAILYIALNWGGAAERGWGVPMATDIAFALGVLALLGDRIPLGLKVFLTALAIVDDIGAVLVIAIFYTSDLSVPGLILALSCIVASVILNRLGVNSPVAYLIVGIAAWLGFLESGVHATIASLLMAFTIPARTRIDGRDFMARMTLLLEKLRSVGVPSDTAMNTNNQQHLFDQMNSTIDQASAPLQRLEHALSAPVTFLVLPVFALANAGVTVHGDIGHVLAEPLVLGIILGLVVGKTVGITGTSWLAVRFKVADLPRGVTWLQMAGVGMLGGIGFTMALFVSALAFQDREQQEAAKIGILVASAAAGTLGYLIVRMASGGAPAGGGAQPAGTGAH